MRRQNELRSLRLRRAQHRHHGDDHRQQAYGADGDSERGFQKRSTRMGRCDQNDLRGRGPDQNGGGERPAQCKPRIVRKRADAYKRTAQHEREHRRKPRLHTEEKCAVRRLPSERVEGRKRQSKITGVNRLRYHADETPFRQGRLPAISGTQPRAIAAARPAARCRTARALVAGLDRRFARSR